MGDFDQDVASMRRMAEYLAPYEKTKEDRADLAILATRELCVHGYDISFYLWKSRHPGVDIWSLQMYSKNQAFLPFSLVCECGTKFLGTADLGLCEFLVRGHKLYVWSVAVAQDGTPIPVPARPEVKVCSYGGLTFSKSASAEVILTA